MTGEKIVFEAWKLPNQEYDFYRNLSEKEQKAYERNWLAIETQKSKLQQAKARMAKTRAVVSDRERKKRTRRLIEIGAAVESVLKSSLGNQSGVIETDDIPALIDYLKKQEDRGAYFSRAITTARGKKELLQEGDTHLIDD